MNKIYKNQTKLTMNIVLNSSLEGVSSAVFKIQKPNGTSGQWVGTITDEETGIVSYDIQSSNDLDVAGEWIAWLELTFSDGGELPSEPVKFIVYNRGT